MPQRTVVGDLLALKAIVAFPMEMFITSAVIVVFSLSLSICYLREIKEIYGHTYFDCLIRFSFKECCIFCPPQIRFKCPAMILARS